MVRAGHILMIVSDCGGEMNLSWIMDWSQAQSQVLALLFISSIGRASGPTLLSKERVVYGWRGSAWLPAGSVSGPVWTETVWIVSARHSRSFEYDR